ncbi:hypothetical protein [Clostridium cochlearium]|nr:hypothetical protein [Clostridium cochlearium]MBU5269220.1 hypothetical protein [Clostridium cochlearium]NOH15415.1 hypothetical protein [Clostridium cochlearium]
MEDIIIEPEKIKVLLKEIVDLEKQYIHEKAIKKSELIEEFKKVLEREVK